MSGEVDVRNLGREKDLERQWMLDLMEATPKSRLGNHQWADQLPWCRRCINVKQGSCLPQASIPS